MGSRGCMNLRELTKEDKKKIWEKYSSFYRATLPKKMYDGNIEIKKAVRAKVKEGIDSRLCRGEEEEKDGNSSYNFK